MDATRDRPGGLRRLRNALRLAYHGTSPRARRFQAAVLLVDLAIIAFFIASPLLAKERLTFIVLDLVVAAVLLADMVARALAATNLPRWLRQPTTIVDIVILATLLLPWWFANFGFLRILRLWTLSRTGFLWRPLRKRHLETWEETGRAVLNLFVFLFVVTGFIYTFFVKSGSGIDGYLDALYFTVTSVTTTGYGDIILPGALGRITSIVTMIVGISLFVRLAQALFRPRKVTFPCPQCGLTRHDPDAVHCKACGHILNIPDHGQD